MKKEWFLWNVLQNPEDITADERMEQIEWKNYYWSYKTLIQLLIMFAVLWPSIVSLSSTYMGEDTGLNLLPNIMVFQIVTIIESGRFLYSCYFGNQEFYDRSKGKTSYILIGLENGVIAWLLFWAVYGAGHPLPWIMLAAGLALYWGLCHLAYLHYAWLMDETMEEKGQKSESWIPAVCGAFLALYFISLNIFAFSARADRVNMSFLTEEEQRMVQEIEHGIDNYYALSNYQMDYTLKTDTQPEKPIYEEDHLYDIFHVRCLASGGELYNQILNPGNDETIYREYHRKSQDPFSWEMAHEGRWISENEWAELWTENQDEPEFWVNEPYTALPNINPQAITSIKKEDHNQNTLYTITYNQDFEACGATLKNNKELTELTATDHYTLNEYNTLIHYDHTETGITRTTQAPRTLQRTITIQSVNKKEIQSTLQILTNQYKN